MQPLTQWLQPVVEGIVGGRRSGQGFALLLVLRQWWAKLEPFAAAAVQLFKICNQVFNVMPKVDEQITAMISMFKP
jgi:hypothetical protein